MTFGTVFSYLDKEYVYLLETPGVLYAARILDISETKKVDDETEMREIINLAIDKELEVWTPRMEKLYTAPQRVTRSKKADSNKKFEKELEDIKL